jgi:histidine triad (HIT) family protein
MGTEGGAVESADWRKERMRIMTVVEGLKRQGVCHVCRDLQTREVFGEQPVVHEDDVYRVVLDRFPLNPGHAIVTYKPHRDDLASLNSQEASRIFKAVVCMAKALKVALGAEKVYLLSMPDGASSHLVFQLIPRYKGQPMGMQLLRLGRRPLKDGARMAARIASVLAPAKETVAEGEAASGEGAESEGAD